MGEIRETEVTRPEQEQIDLIPEERLKELLSILLPYGYSHYNGTFYTGVSPYIGKEYNIITIVANDLDWAGGIFSICMDRFTEDEDEKDCLGFYKGIMKVIAPELHSHDDEFAGGQNVLDFYWADDKVQENAFPAKVTYKPL